MAHANAIILCVNSNRLGTTCYTGRDVYMGERMQERTSWFPVTEGITLTPVRSFAMGVTDGRFGSFVLAFSVFVAVTAA